MGDINIDSPTTIHQYPAPANQPTPSQPPAPSTGWTKTGIAALLAAGIAAGGATGYGLNKILNPATPQTQVVTNPAGPSPVNIVTRDSKGVVTKTAPGRMYADGKVEGQDAGGNWIQYIQDQQGNWIPKSVK